MGHKRLHDKGVYGSNAAVHVNDLQRRKALLHIRASFIDLGHCAHVVSLTACTSTLTRCIL